MPTVALFFSTFPVANFIKSKLINSPEVAKFPFNNFYRLSQNCFLKFSEYFIVLLSCSGLGKNYVFLIISLICYHAVGWGKIMLCALNNL